MKPPNPKYIPKPYEQMQYPGQRIQVDVKFVPTACIASSIDGEKCYQYTAIDEYSRYRFLEAFQENSTYSSAQFALHVIQHFARMGIRVECIQTDNGFEFTNPAEPDIHDIGILAFTDPVAIDQASIDLCFAAEGSESLQQRVERQNGLHTLEHAEEIGLGSHTYNLVNIDE